MVHNEIARIGFYGDIHLCSKNYGAHRDYAKESLEYFTRITEIAEKRNLTHLIGCGDFSYGRFHTLEYRLAVEKELEKQFKITNGNRWELEGNHDTDGKGLLERGYYIQKGLIRASENFSVGCVNITMVDYGKTMTAPVNIIDEENKYNILVAHDYYKFDKVNLPNFGKAILLDTLDRWYGMDIMVCGHVHKIMDFSGYVTKGDMAHECQVTYLGCMSRPSFREGFLDNVGRVLVVTVYDDDTIDLNFEEVKLWAIEDSFNLEEKEIEAQKKKEKADRVDISDVVKQLDSHDRNVGNPEDIISSLEGIDERYKTKAIALLKSAMS